jgi:hypothetical protein
VSRTRAADYIVVLVCVRARVRSLDVALRPRAIGAGPRLLCSLAPPVSLVARGCFCPASPFRGVVRRLACAAVWCTGAAMAQGLLVWNFLALFLGVWLKAYPANRKLVVTHRRKNPTAQTAVFCFHCRGPRTSRLTTSKNVGQPGRDANLAVRDNENKKPWPHQGEPLGSIRKSGPLAVGVRARAHRNESLGVTL